MSHMKQNRLGLLLSTEQDYDQTSPRGPNYRRDSTLTSVALVRGRDPETKQYSRPKCFIFSSLSVVTSSGMT